MSELATSFCPVRQRRGRRGHGADSHARQAVADAAQWGARKVVGLGCWRDGEVTVACPEAVRAQELDLMSELVLGRLNAALGRPAVRRLRVQARPVPAPRS